MNARELTATLDAWVAARWIREVDAVFARFLCAQDERAQPLVALAAALASHQLGRGHACLDLEATLRAPAESLGIPGGETPTGTATPAAPPPATPADLLRGVSLEAWQQALREAACVGTQAQAEGTPLVLAPGRLYLRRYWTHERVLRAAIDRRLAPDAGDTLLGRPQHLQSALDTLFPRAGLPAGEPDWQKIACALALRSRFTIVTGGPGTGKTTTVVKLLALLQHLSLTLPAGGRRLRIRLAAPTGKAAARLKGSIAGAIEQLPLEHLDHGEAVRQAIPIDVTTVHRLMGRQGEMGRFRHGPGQPLALDVLVIDEASMVDLEAMAAVAAAMPPGGRLVLLGDKDQLTSVEAGSVLGELCRRADAGHYRPDTCEWLAAITGERIPERLVDAGGGPLDQAVVKLRHSWRFGAGTGIGQLATAMNEGRVEQVEALLAQPPAGLARIAWNGTDAALRRLVLGDAGQGDGGLRSWLTAMQQAPSADASRDDWDAWARRVLQAQGHFQLLAAVRRGPFGVDALNVRIAGLLQAAGLTAAASGWFAGRPVMVTRNDYTLGLMNGDVGVTLTVPATSGAPSRRTDLRVVFLADDGAVRWVLPSRLLDVETAFAMTVHKSQGSEFRHAALVLPDRDSPVLTRELVYTAITRASQRFTLLVPPDSPALAQAVRRQTQRAGGLLAPDSIAADE